MLHNYVKHDSSETITFIFCEGDALPVTISKSHPKWEFFFTRLHNGSLSVMTESMARSELSSSAGAWLTKLSDRVSASMYGVTLDGVKVESKVAEGISKALGDNPEDADHIRAMGRFLEKAETNPSLPGADQLYDWILSEGLTLTSDGDFVGYKKVINPTHHPVGAVDLDKNPIEDTLPEGYWVSAFRGGGIVDGVEYTAHVPNYIGAVVEMPRDKVDANGAVECSVGLHVGTFGYAKGFYSGSEGTLLLVKVNPRDVVSVPDYDFNKLRACKYTVIASDVKSKLDEHLYVDVVHAPIIKEKDVVDVDTASVVESIIAKIRASRSK